MNVVFLTSAFRESQYPPPDKPEIAFAGRSNVGKSSLINILFNRKGLARTSSRPGRTQSINFFSVDNRLYFVDLPGYGYARVPIKVKKSWQHMVETYLDKRSNLRAVVVILDIRRDTTSGDIQLLTWLKYYGIPAIPVLTKADKLSRQQARTRSQLIGRQIGEIFSTGPTVFSAKTRQGRDDLWRKIDEAI
ncbi:MAG: YihA family ribosome biogenesis GTP-binding protein [Desulfobacteraceae bacterium]|nr:MAG: YihA family ribosome biogenesis GTP-binding protein [Desulfobacteraceae bacterium]